MSEAFGATILVATRDRADVLRGTLESLFCCLSTGDERVQVIVVDNGSRDHTRTVIESFLTNPSWLYLLENKPGKNAALNRGLSQARGEVVLFTDDDVYVSKRWVRAFLRAAQDLPDFDFFAGPVVARFPPNAPAWTAYPCFDFGSLSLGEKDRPLGPRENAYGASMAVRHSVLANGLRFDESIGPGHGIGKKGSETSFQIELRRRGYRGFYVADAAVEHRIDSHPVMLTRSYHRRRKYLEGRGYVHMGQSDPGRYQLLGRWPLIPLIEAAQWFGRWLFARSLERRYLAEMQLCFTVGRIAEFYQQAAAKGQR